MPKEYIEREALIENLKRFAPEHFRELTKMLIEKEPASDVVEVVRCKDCRCFEERHYEDEGEPPKIKTACILLKRGIYPDDYCSYGERKEV